MSRNIKNRNDHITARFIALNERDGYRSRRAAQIIADELANQGYCGEKYILTAGYILAVAQRNKKGMKNRLDDMNAKS